MKVYTTVYIEIDESFRILPHVFRVFSDKDRAESFANQSSFLHVIESFMDKSEIPQDYDEILLLREENERLRSRLRTFDN